MDEFQSYGRQPVAPSAPSRVNKNHKSTQPPQPPSQGHTQMQVVIASPSKGQPQPIFFDDDEDELGSYLIASDTKKRRRKPAVATSTGFASASADMDTSVAMLGPAQRKKPGRPKGWKPGLPYSATTTRKPRSEAVAPANTATAVPMPDPTQRTKPGRRKGMPYSTTTTNPRSEAAKEIRAQHLRDQPEEAARMRGPRTKGPPKPRSRPGKKPPPTAREVYKLLTPLFVPFICEWRGCKAQLRNMETLRRHVRIVHGREKACAWAKCADKQPTETTFAKDSEFMTHVEEAHLVPFEWHMGEGYHNDGPVVDKNGAEAGIPKYLLDKDGNQVTPYMAEIEVEDNATRLARKKQLRATKAWMNAEAPTPSASEDEGDGARRL